MPGGASFCWGLRFVVPRLVVLNQQWVVVVIACVLLDVCSRVSFGFACGPRVFSAAVRLSVRRVLLVPVPAAALSVVQVGPCARLPEVGLDGCRGICSEFLRCFSKEVCKFDTWPLGI